MGKSTYDLDNYEVADDKKYSLDNYEVADKVGDATILKKKGGTTLPTTSKDVVQPLDGGLSNTPTDNVVEPKTNVDQSLQKVSLTPNEYDYDKEDNPFDLAKKAAYFDTKGDNSVDFGDVATFTPDAKAQEAAKNIRQDLKARGYDADALNEDLKGIDTELMFSQPNTSKEDLAKLKISNPINYQKVIDDTKNIHAIKKGSGIDEANKYIDLYAGQPTVQDDINSISDKVKKQQEIIGQSLSGDERDAALNRVKNIQSSFINTNTAGLDDEYNNSSLKNSISLNQYAGLKTLQLFEPEKYNQAIGILNNKITPLYDVNIGTIKDFQSPVGGGMGKVQSTDASKGTLSQETIDQQIGRETVLKNLNDIGKQNLLTELNNQQYNLNKSFENAETPEIKDRIKQKYLENQFNINSINSDKSDDTNYPLTTKLKFDNQVKELTNSAPNVANYYTLRFLKNIKNSGDAIDDMAVSMFGSDAHKNELQQQRLGENKTMENMMYLPESLRGNNSLYILQPSDDLKKQVNKILDGRTLGSLNSDERQKVNDLIANNQDKIKTITNPEAGKSKNFFSKSTLYTTAGFAGDITALAMQMGSLKGLGASAELAEATSLYGNTYSEAYNQAAEEGKTPSEANDIAMLHGGIMALAVKFGSKFGAVKNMLEGAKSPIAKEIAGISEATWDNVVNKNKTLINRLANSAKNVTKENSKMLATYGVGTTIATDLADNAFYGQKKSTEDIANDAYHATKDMLVGSAGLMGVGLLTGAKEHTATPLEKAAIWDYGDNPDLGKKRIDEAIAKGDLTQNDGDLRKKAIDNISNLINKVPEKTDKGKLMTDDQKLDYLYNLVVKDKVIESAKNLPQKQADKVLHQSMVAEYKNDLILEPQTENQLNQRVKTLEKILTPNKDGSGDIIEIPDNKRKDYEAELQAIKEHLSEHPEMGVMNTKPSIPIEGTDEQGIPLNAAPDLKSNLDQIEENRKLDLADAKDDNAKKEINDYYDAQAQNELNKSLKNANQTTNTQTSNEGTQPIKTEEVSSTESKPTETLQPPKEEIKVGEMLDKVGTYKGDKGQFIQEGQAIEFHPEGTNRIIELGNVEELKNKPISELGIEHEESVVSVNKEGDITVRDEPYKNNYSDPLAAINRDAEGNVVSVNLETPDGQKRTFRGKAAEDIAYQIHLKEISKHIEDGNITEQQVADFTANNDVAKSEPVIKDIESKAEGTTEAELNAAIQQSDELLNPQNKGSDISTESIGQEYTGQSTSSVINGNVEAKSETISKFDQAKEMLDKIEETDGASKKRALAEERRKFMDDNPSMKRIDDNMAEINKQLEEKGLIKKEGNCP
jgi:hypothetical protein